PCRWPPPRRAGITTGGIIITAPRRFTATIITAAAIPWRPAFWAASSAWPWAAPSPATRTAGRTAWWCASVWWKPLPPGAIPTCTARITDTPITALAGISRRPLRSSSRCPSRIREAACRPVNTRPISSSAARRWKPMAPPACSPTARGSSGLPPQSPNSAKELPPFSAAHSPGLAPGIFLAGGRRGRCSDALTKRDGKASVPLMMKVLASVMTKLIPPLAALALVLSAGTALAHDYMAGSMAVLHPWTRATPPNAETAGAYLTLRNDGDTEDALIGARSGIADKVEIHSMTVDGGVMRMRPVGEAGVAVQPGETVALAPG